jgi:hypothetical protein
MTSQTTNIRNLISAKSLALRLRMTAQRASVGLVERDPTVEVVDQKPTTEGGVGMLVVTVRIPYVNVKPVKKEG